LAKHGSVFDAGAVFGGEDSGEKRCLGRTSPRICQPPNAPRLRWGIILQINCLTIRGQSPIALEVSMLHRIAPQAVSGSGTLSSGPDD
jgi:hypothetical protein